MGKWDSPSSSSGDRGSDKPNVPRVPAYEPPPASYETPRHNGREGTSGQGEGTRARDKTAEQGTRGREGTTATAPARDTSPENDTVARAGKLIEAYKERADTFQAEVTELREHSEALEDELDEKDEFIDQLQDENGQLKSEVRQLRTELAARSDDPAEGRPAAGTEPGNRRPPAGPEQPGAHDRPRVPGVIGDSGNQARVPGAVGDPPADLKPVQAAASNENNENTGTGKGGAGKTGGADTGGGGRGPDAGSGGGDGGGGGNGPDGPNGPKPPNDPHIRDVSGKGADQQERTIQRQDRTIERQERTIERQESEIDRKDAELARKDAEIEKPKTRVSELESGGGTASEAIAAKESGDADQEVQKKTRPWDRIHMPGDKAKKAIAGAVGTADAIAIGTHLITTTEGAIAMAAAGFGWAVATWGKEKWDKRQERKRNADQSEG